MRVLWVIVGGVAGLVVGAMIGFALALAVAPPRNDGTYAFREMIIGLPTGAIIGCLLGLVWGFRTRLGGP